MKRDSIEVHQVRKALRFFVRAVAIPAVVLVAACSTTPDAGDIATAVGIESLHRHVSRVEEPAVDPGNALRIVGADWSLEGQQEVILLYRDALHDALSTLLADAKEGGDCSKCPVLSSRILAIDEQAPNIAVTVQLTVLFKLTYPDRGNDVAWWKVISKTAQRDGLDNFSGVERVRRTREDAISAVIRELGTALPVGRESGG